MSPQPASQHNAFRTVKNTSDLIAAGVCIVLYVALAAAQIDLPGLYYDEAADGVPAVQWVAGQSVDVLRDAGWTVGGRRLPLMVFDYVGPWNTYLLIPLLGLFGSSPAVIRGLTIGAGILTLLLAYGFTRSFAGRAVALGTLALLAVNPAFVLWTREGIHVTSILLVFSLGSLWALWRWWQTRAAWPLVLAGFCLGAGLTAKFLFLWWIVGLVAAYLALIGLRRLMGSSGKSRGGHPGGTDPAPSVGRAPAPPPLAAAGATRLVDGHAPAGGNMGPAPPLGWLATSGRGGTAVLDPPVLSSAAPAAVAAPAAASRRQTPTWAWPAALAAFALGALPLIVFNLRTQGTIEVLTRNASTTHLGTNNLDLPANLAKVADHTLAALQGSVFWYFGGIFENRLWPVLLGLATVAWIALFAASPAARRVWRRVAFLYVVFALVIVQSAFTVSSLEPTHHLIAWPLPQLLIVWCAVALAGVLNNRWPRWGALAAAAPALLVGALFAGDLLTTLRYHDALRRTGGLAAHSDAVYRLAGWLEERGVDDPIALDWGLRNSVLVLTDGRVVPVEIFMYDREPPPLFFDWLYGALTKDPDQLYILHADPFAVFPRRAAFEDLARKLGREVRLEGQFRQRDGTVIYEVYSARPG